MKFLYLEAGGRRRREGLLLCRSMKRKGSVNGGDDEGKRPRIKYPGYSYSHCYAYMYTYVHLCVSVCLYLCMYVSMYVCVCMYVYFKST